MVVRHCAWQGQYWQQHTTQVGVAWLGWHGRISWWGGSGLLLSEHLLFQGQHGWLSCGLCSTSSCCPCSFS